MYKTMKIKRFKIPIYEYDVIYVELTKSSHEIDEMRVLLENIQCNSDDIKETLQEMKEGVKNGGNHFYNLSSLISIIMIHYHDNQSRKKATIAHEKRHLEDRILKHYRIDDIESAGLLSGWLARKIP